MEPETRAVKTGDRIQKKAFLRASRSRVWRAIANPKEFGTWFGVELDGEFWAGSKVKGKIVPTKVDEEVANLQRPYEGTPFELVVDRVEPERVLSFRWPPYAVEEGVDHGTALWTQVSFELEDVKDGVMLTVTESGFDRLPAARRAKAFASNEEGWSKQMTLIEKFVTRS